MVKDLIKKYWDVIPYLFFGACTTVVNVVVYWACAHPLGIGTILSSIIAWFLAVLFAYVTNRKWVFHSEAHGHKAVIKEIISFFTYRIATGIVDWLFMIVFVKWLSMNDIVIKTTANFVVIVLNYLASKLVIFKKEKNK